MFFIDQIYFSSIHKCDNPFPNFQDIPVLMVRSGEEKHPNDLLLTRMPVPPVCIRPSVVSEVKSGTTEDDVTMKLMEIMLTNDVLKKHKRDGAPSKTLFETWEHLQVRYCKTELVGKPSYEAVFPDFYTNSCRYNARCTSTPKCQAFPQTCNRNEPCVPSRNVSKENKADSVEICAENASISREEPSFRRIRTFESTRSEFRSTWPWSSRIRRL